MGYQVQYKVSFEQNEKSKLEAYVIQLACGRAPGRLRRLDTGAPDP